MAEIAGLRTNSLLLGTALLALAVGSAPAAARAESVDGGSAEALARLKKEPDCPSVQRAALAYFNISKENVVKYRKGASRKAAAPVFEVSGGYARADLDESTYNYYEYPGPLEGIPEYLYLTKGAGGYGWDVRGKLAWDLPQLVFNAEVLDVASLAGLVQGVLKEVTRLYYMRRRLQLDLILTPPADEATRLTKELRLEELSALLDAMTGGYFQKELKNRGLVEGEEKGASADPTDLFK
jgi:hypothetical protein